MEKDYPNIKKVCELLDITMKADLSYISDEESEDPFEEVEEVFSLGVNQDLSAGIWGCRITPWYNSLDTLEMYCKENMDKAEKASEAQILPDGYLHEWE